MLIEREGLQVIDTDRPPAEPARLVDDFTPELVDVGTHGCAPGAASRSPCGRRWRPSPSSA